ncbi:MAG TPA: HAMP domain-containing sensor histidine kinase [Solirubrobacteraceae bacterium]|nr:HAMP domain-containing sensor histidine kinase [Solirubrobacteraceae bacterium]
MTGHLGWIVAIVAIAAAVWALSLRRLLAARMELVARACHELRGPLTVARLGIELLGRDAALPVDALQAIDLELASAGLALEDLSAAPTGRRGPWRPRPVDVTALLGTSFEAFRPVARACGVELDLRWQGEPAVVDADRLRLAQATRNLIANAIEHGHGRVEVRGHAGEDGVEIEVADGGQGLPAPVADLAARRRAGRGRRGRGLAIAAEVAERHGGRLVAASDESGSRVSLSLPVPRG